MRIDITLYNLDKDDLILLSTKSLDEGITIKEYIEKIIRNEANRLRKEKSKEDKEIIDKLRDMAK